jgi:hypothetical protein
MNEKSEPNQNAKMADEVSLGEPEFRSFPFSELSHSEDSDIFVAAKIREFSRSVLSAEAWFRTADELIAAMDLLEPHVEGFWEDVRSVAFAVDMTSAVPSKTSAVPSKKSAVPSKKSAVRSNYSLINQHMMLAGFAIENLCKGYLASRLSHEERESVKSGALPDSLNSHYIQGLIQQTGMTLSDTEKDLAKRIREAVVWRGRYPSASSHRGIRPFAQIGSDIRNIKTLLQKLRKHVLAKD